MHYVKSRSSLPRICGFVKANRVEIHMELHERHLHRVGGRDVWLGEGFHRRRRSCITHTSPLPPFLCIFLLLRVFLMQPALKGLRVEVLLTQILTPDLLSAHAMNTIHRRTMQMLGRLSRSCSPLPCQRLQLLILLAITQPRCLLHHIDARASYFALLLQTLLPLQQLCCLRVCVRGSR